MREKTLCIDVDVISYFNLEAILEFIPQMFLTFNQVLDSYMYMYK